MRVILLGPSGAGKGTQAEFITKRYAIPAISTGDMLRQAIIEDCPLGRQAKAAMAKGDLVADDLVIKLVKSRLKMADCANGYLLDGFPRTPPQADALQLAGIAVEHIIALDVPDEDIIARVSGRRIHPASGRVYHTVYQPPKMANLDDDTGEPLVQRDDDREEVVSARLKTYYELTAPLVDFYRGLAANNPSIHFHVVSGLGDSRMIAVNIFDCLEGKTHWQ